MSERARGDDGDRAEVEHWSDVYEDALRRHDVATLDALFWDDPAVLRFGVAGGMPWHRDTPGYFASEPAGRIELLRAVEEALRGYHPGLYTAPMAPARPPVDPSMQSPPSDGRG